MLAPGFLRSFQALELAIRAGSLRAAAEVLGITPAAVGQRVKALEDYLGMDLLTRGRSGLQPTAALKIALPHLAAAFHELETTARLARLDERDRLEGFPLLHLDFYKDDPAAPGWTQWIAAGPLRRTAPERGIRFQRVARAVEAVLADAGLAICGVALISDLFAEGKVSLPFPMATGRWTGHVFQASFRSDALARPQVRRFRQWLAAEAGKTAQWIDGQVDAAAGLSIGT